ncbi:hypothetical protein [Opitutus terrae]|uniref:DUF3102 domain-containing protein n=1 Tax=Opitutus terrae (strain DSM 11246 / JCM 15787 / PB90-1) TaxID=452637 RepID=B1ZUB1_OPITP|nr:hypothetical protein [Opitutus terrae]ACB76673.1 hypothetical protein Oter_3396 [Opitutus terrae PB90-1]
MKNLPAIRDLDARVQRILHQHTTIMTSAAQMAAAAVIAGLELKALKKECGHGNWEEFFASALQQHGLKLRTAQNYMALADGLKSKALKTQPDAFLKLLDSAPSELSKADQQKLTKAVGKVTDGKALSELYQDFGIVKKPQGSGAKGGNTRGKGGTDTGDDADAPAPKPEDAGWHEITKLLNNLLVEHLEPDNHFWNQCTEARRRELHGNLVDACEAVGATLKKENRA